MKKLKFTDTTLRDAQQSLLATRMTTDEMLDIVNQIDLVGYESVEMWGGATFDSCIRYLNEDPWERLKLLKEQFKNTKMQMLLRGQNILGYSNYSDDVLELFIRKAIENGIDVIRTFDALNDSRNLEKSIQFAKQYGAEVQGAISYTVSPVHTVEKYIDFAKELYEMGVDSICIKDMAGLMTPKIAYDMVKAFKSTFSLPIQIHSHCTTGLASMTYYAAIEAGADVVDTAISALAYGTSQPAIEPFTYTFSNVTVNKNYLSDINEYFKKVREKHFDTDLALKTIDSRVLKAQIPGGMLSNLINQLKDQHASHLYDEVLKEIPVIRREMGYPPLVTPTSQIIGVQAVLNVLHGERYKVITNEIKKYVKGMYGRPPIPIESDLVEKILGNEKRIRVRPADLLLPSLPKLKEEIGLLASTDEDLLTYALFGQIAKKFLKKRYYKSLGVDFSILDCNNENCPEVVVYPV